jgi:uncharacterized protein (DUF924 family)
MTHSEANVTPAEIIAFWREAGPERWFNKDAAFDEEVRQRFLDVHEVAAAGRLRAWETSADGALALLILLDQFPRNMFRGDAAQFATDPLALALATGAVDAGLDGQVPPDRRGFFYMPFQHSEEIEDQRRSLLLFTRLGDPHLLHYARLHHDIVERFGRFPHRNAILGRTPRPDEIAAGDVHPW